MNPAPASTNTPPGIANVSPRIDLIDALRGFALFGILLVHCGQWFAAAQLPRQVYEAQGGGVGNGISQTVIGIFFDGKFYTFFSFLFGLSFALMLTRSTDSPGRFYGRFAWRLVVLGGIGLLHHMLWRGDILSIYALVGFALLPFGRLSNRVVLVVGLLLVTNVPTRIQVAYDTYLAPPKPKKPDSDNGDKEVVAYYKVVKEGNLRTLAGFNLAAFGEKMRFQVESGRIYITLGFFLLGLYAGRRQLFQQFSRHKAWFRQRCRFTGFAVLALTAIGVGLLAVFGNTKQPPAWAMTVFNVLYDLQSTCLTLFYITGLSLLWQRPFWQKTVTALASVGKVALSSYVGQSVVGTFLFFGYGLGLIGEIPLWQAALLTFPIFAAQIFLSRLWLKKFRYGPLEWLWRSATYLRVQPLRHTVSE